MILWLSNQMITFFFFNIWFGYEHYLLPFYIWGWGWVKEAYWIAPRGADRRGFQSLVFKKKVQSQSFQSTFTLVNIKMASYQYRKSHCGNQTIWRPCYLHNGISYTSKMASSYWIRAQWQGYKSGLLELQGRSLSHILSLVASSLPRGTSAPE